MPRVSQTEMVYEKLKERIDGGYYSPAESLPEMELATELEVSRNTVKKALLMLENDAYVVVEPNKGAKVRSFSRQEVLDYLQLRVELEGFIIRLTVPCFTEADVDGLAALLTRMGERHEANDLMGYSTLNQEFHNLIYAKCPNKTATELLLRLKAQMRKYNAKTILVPGRDARSYEEHRAILEAIRTRNAQEAEACMRSHIENVRKVFEDYYTLLF